MAKSQLQPKMCFGGLQAPLVDLHTVFHAGRQADPAAVPKPLCVAEFSMQTYACGAQGTSGSLASL